MQNEAQLHLQELKSRMQESNSTELQRRNLIEELRKADVPLLASPFAHG